MDSPRSPHDPSAYFESLMQAGQQSFKQFDDAMAAAMGLGDKPAERQASPFVAAANLQRDAILQLWKFWNTTLVKALGVEEKVQPGKGDRRFKDDAWAQSPYYDLLKQAYLLGLKATDRSWSSRRRSTKRQNCSSSSMRGNSSTR